MFVKDINDNYQNLNNGNLESVFVSGAGSAFGISAFYRFGSATNHEEIRLAGEWATYEEASEAIRELVNGIDPSTYGD